MASIAPNAAQVDAHIHPDWAPWPRMPGGAPFVSDSSHYAAHTGWLRCYCREYSALDVLGSQLSPGPVSDDIHAP